MTGGAHNSASHVPIRSREREDVAVPEGATVPGAAAGGGGDMTNEAGFGDAVNAQRTGGGGRPETAVVPDPAACV
jgi:hypothetical protein